MALPRPLACLVAAALAGCGGSPPPLTPPSPHGGMMLDLPDGRGVVEVVRQEAPDQPGRSRLLVYFLDAGLKPMTPSPASATLKPKQPRGVTIELKPAADGLESPPFEAPGGIEGELTATVGGKPTAVTIGIR